MTELFSTKIWQYDILSRAREDEFTNLSKVVLDNVQDESHRRSNFSRSYRTKDNFLPESLHKNNIGLEVAKCYRESIADYGYTPNKIRFTYWGIATHNGGYNIRHCHPGCLLSGVLYLSAPKGSGALRLTDPRAAKRFEPAMFRNEGHSGHGDFLITPKKGLLVIFPAWLEHEVEPSIGIETPRIIMSFNAVVS